MDKKHNSHMQRRPPMKEEVDGEQVFFTQELCKQQKIMSKNTESYIKVFVWIMYNKK